MFLGTYTLKKREWEWSNGLCSSFRPVSSSFEQGSRAAPSCGNRKWRNFPPLARAPRDLKMSCAVIPCSALRFHRLRPIGSISTSTIGDHFTHWLCLSAFNVLRGYFIAQRCACDIMNVGGGRLIAKQNTWLTGTSTGPLYVHHRSGSSAHQKTRLNCFYNLHGFWK